MPDAEPEELKPQLMPVRWTHVSRGSWAHQLRTQLPHLALDTNSHTRRSSPPKNA